MADGITGYAVADFVLDVNPATLVRQNINHLRDSKALSKPFESQNL